MLEQTGTDSWRLLANVYPQMCKTVQKKKKKTTTNCSILITWKKHCVEREEQTVIIAVPYYYTDLKTSLNPTKETDAL
jgi:hypothetical protein